MEEIGRISLTDHNAASKQDAGIVCRVCQKQWSKYACPRCNVRYCSLPCYKAHSDRCTEGFYRENAEDQLRQTKADPEDRRKMLQTLKRMQESEKEEALGSEEDEVSDMEEDGGFEISEETLLRLGEKGNDLSLEDLLPNEWAALQRAAASGALSRFIPAWEPWYLSPEAKRIRISATGTRPVREVSARGKISGDSSKTPAEEAFDKLVGGSTRKTDVEVVEGNGHTSLSPSKRASAREELSEGFVKESDVEGSHDVSSEDMDADVTEEPAIPAPPEEDLPPLSSLIKSPPSPLVGCHVTSVLYAYCYMMRLFNGDWTADPADAAETLGVVTPVLSEGATPTSVEDALYGGLERACSPSLAGPSGSAFARGFLADVNGLLSLGRPGVVVALADVQRMFVAAENASNRSGKKDRGKSEGQLSGMSNSAGSLEKSAQSSMIDRKQKQVVGALAKLAADRAGSTSAGDSTQRKTGLKKRRSKEPGRKNNPELVRRKVFFFLVWANEQPGETFQMLAAAVAEYAEQEKRRYESQAQFESTDRTRFTKPGAIEELA